MSKIIHDLSRSAPARLVAQATVAAAAAYFAASALQLDDTTWAVISALFTVQASVGSTLRKAATRLGGAIAGLAIGLVCIFTIGADNSQTIVSLVVAVAVMSLLSAVRPELNFGLVTVAILILGPGGDIVETAWGKAAAVALGCALGALAGLMILPLSAHRSAAEHLGNVVRRCRELLDRSIEALTSQTQVDLQPIHADIRRELEAAQTHVAQSQYMRFRRHPGRPLPRDLLVSVQRLWHTLILFDRLDHAALPQEPRDILSPSLRQAAEAIGDYLDELADALAAGTVPRSAEAILPSVEKVMTSLEEVRRRGATRALPGEDAERVFAFSFALQQTYRNIARVAQTLGAAGPAEGTPNPSRSATARR
ncbi:MAG TPA: FUSC family protein [Aurantimonas sp.]|nr:FUSC family protein [Aurantimonas sp.]